MSINRRSSPLAMYAVTIVAALATARCGSSASPAQPTSQILSGVALSSSSVAAGATVQGTVSLTAAASAGGTSISLSSSNTAVATVLTPLNVQAGSTSAGFTVTGMSAGTAVITASINGNSQSSTLTVTGAPTLSSITLTPASVLGGESVTGTATLSSVAPVGGAVVSLSANDPATVPPNVTVPAGSRTATFTVTTRVVTATSAATVSGSFGGTSASAVLSVGPPTVATASFGVRGTDTTDTCVLINNGNSLECTFDGSTSTAPGTIVAWDWTYTVATTKAQTTTGPVLTIPAADCAFIPPPPLPAAASSFPLTVTLRVHDSLGNVSAVKVDNGARVLPGGMCGF